MAIFEHHIYRVLWSHCRAGSHELYPGRGLWVSDSYTCGVDIEYCCTIRREPIAHSPASRGPHAIIANPHNALPLAARLCPLRQPVLHPHALAVVVSLNKGRPGVPAQLTLPAAGLSLICPWNTPKVTLLLLRVLWTDKSAYPLGIQSVEGEQMCSRP